MKFGRKVVNNLKCRNEKDAQKRQFCDFAPEYVHHFWAGNNSSKKNFD